MNKSLVIKRSVVLAGHKTSVSLEDIFWNSLKEIASETDRCVAEIVGDINKTRQNVNLSSAIRTYVLSHYKALAAAPK